MLTNEDHLIFCDRMSVKAQAALHNADRRSASTMRLAANRLLCPCGSVRSSVTQACVLGMHCPIGKGR